MQEFKENELVCIYPDENHYTNDCWDKVLDIKYIRSINKIAQVKGEGTFLNHYIVKLLDSNLPNTP